jgi:hypothetical protein
MAVRAVPIAFAGVVLLAAAAGGTRAAVAAPQGPSGARPSLRPFSWAPADSAAAVRGREVATRLDQLTLWEISVELNNAFSVENRRAVAVAEEELRRVPGVRRVLGPARLLDIAVDEVGKVTTRPVLDRGEGESGDEIARQRVARRADAVGWFLPTDGGRVRFLIDADDLAPLRPAIDRAIASSGLRLLHAAGAHLDGEALWPAPGDVAGAAAAMAAAWVLFVLLAGRRAHRSAGALTPRGRALVVLAAALGAAAPFALAAVPPVRAVALRAAAVAAVLAALVLAFERPAAAAPAGPAAAAARRRPPAARPPGPALAVALLLGAAALALGGRMRFGTVQWRRTPLLFIDVRGDLDEPVVLREVRRLTDFARAQPGVAAAWSVADIFFGVAQPGGEVGRIPDAADAARRIMAQARPDPAVALGLAADRREALIAIRFDDEDEAVRGGPIADRREIVERLETYLRTELRAALVHVDLTAPGLAPVTRSLGQGQLAVDARERILRICARSGRSLSEAELASVERVARQAATLPAGDLHKLRSEIAAEVRGFLQDTAPQWVSAKAIAATAADRRRLVDELAAESSDASVAEARQILRRRVGSHIGDDVADELADALDARLARVRRRHVARAHVREMLFGADLPTEGILADEVSAATVEAMGPVVGVPVSPTLPGAYHIDAEIVGGAAQDRALSEFLRPGFRWGVGLAVALLAAILLAAARARGLFWLPVALAPFAVAVLIPCLLQERVGMLALSFMGGALAGGAALVVSLAARRRGA